MSKTTGIQKNNTGWKAGDEFCRAAYERVCAGETWQEACKATGAIYSTAQMRYRARGLPSPRRANTAPLGGREAAAERSYTRALNGEVARDVAKAEGISYQYLRRYCARLNKLAPASNLRAVKEQIKAMFNGASA